MAASSLSAEHRAIFEAFKRLPDDKIGVESAYMPTIGAWWDALNEEQQHEETTKPGSSLGEHPYAATIFRAMVAQMNEPLQRLRQLAGQDVYQVFFQGRMMLYADAIAKAKFDVDYVRKASIGAIDI
jgi:hypothetical protein